MFAGSELQLVEFWGIDKPLHTLLEVCSACKDKVEIKCMGSVGGKHQQNQNFIYSSLISSTWSKLRLMLCILFYCNMSDKIRRLSMNVAFKHIWQKKVEFLNQWKDCLCLHNVSIFTWLWSSSSRYKMCTFQFNWLKLWDQESDSRNKFKELNMLG
jgi:hypothetical protein